MSSAIVLESAIVYVYAINEDGLCEWEQIPRFLEAVSFRSAD
jgi:predicted metal-binding protein